MALTKDQIAVYLADPWTCPFCGRGQNGEVEPLSGEAGEYEEMFTDGQEVYGHKHCTACGKSWRDYYKLHDIEEEDADGCAVPNAEG